MIYLDTSAALAHLLAEDRRPPESLWNEVLISSRLLEYEMWTRINNLGLAQTHAEEVRLLLGRVAFGGRQCPGLCNSRTVKSSNAFRQFFRILR